MQPIGYCVFVVLVLRLLLGAASTKKRLPAVVPAGFGRLTSHEGALAHLADEFSRPTQVCQRPAYLAPLAHISSIPRA